MLTDDYRRNTEMLAEALAVKDSFDLIERRLHIHEREICFFYIDGFVKDSEMQRVMQTMLSLKELGGALYTERRLPYTEVAIATELDELVMAVLSGQTVLLAESFVREAIIIDLRTYPSRQTAEPDTDRVMQGAHDGFVETLVTNTALIRRRVRDRRLKMHHVNLGGSSATDVVISYIEGVADGGEVEKIKQKISALSPRSLTLGFQSLAECLIRRGWWNPFPKIRTTERPDAAAAQLMEGSILVICDTSPQVMILPTSIFQYIEQADDYYFPPLTGTYLRLVRVMILLFSLVATPLWYLAVKNGDVLPESLRFLLPSEPGALPILLQLFLAELAIDGLKIASMNTPDMLSNSLSIVGGLILGDFAVEVGWLSADVILYMAFVAIANFAQQNHELGYAFKFIRVTTLLFVALFDWVGLILGAVLFVFLAAKNSTVSGGRYLYPLVPFSGRALLGHLVRAPKSDMGKK